MINVYWTGIHEFQARLFEISAAVNAAGFEALSEVANLLADRAKENAPVLTGALRRGITVEPIVGGGGGWSTRVGPTVIYSRRIELGFSGVDALGRSYHEAGHPYFVPAYDETIPEAAAIFYERFAAAIEV